MPQSTAAHQVIVALVTAAAARLPDVQVLDGPRATPLEDDAVIFGAGEPSVVARRSAPDYGGRCTETGDVISVISCYSGEPDVTSVRARVTGILAELEAMLREDPTIGGVVDDSMIGSDLELTQRLDDGAVVALGFTVTYEAHI